MQALAQHYHSNFRKWALLHKLSALPLLIILSIFSLQSFATLQLPNGLDTDKRKVVLKSIGFSGTTKHVSNGYTLGGYDGVEFSYQIESIPFSEVNHLSQKNIDQGNQILTRLGIAKGFYHDVEIGFQFIPFFMQTEMSGYSASLKYTVFEDENRPFNVDFVIHGGGINFANLLGVQSVGMDLIGTYYRKYWSFYTGVGQTRLIGSFIGGNNGLTSDNQTATEDMSQNRIFAGLSYDFQTFQLGMQVERFFEGTFIVKIGKRF